MLPSVQDNKQMKISLASLIQHQAFASIRAITRPEAEMRHSCWKSRLPPLPHSKPLFPAKQNVPVYNYLKKKKATRGTEVMLVVFKNSKNDNKCFYFISLFSKPYGRASSMHHCLFMLGQLSAP
jgi:hypothetical protein